MSEIVAKEQARIAGVIADYMARRVFVEDNRDAWAGTPQENRTRRHEQAHTQYMPLPSLRKMARHIASRELKIPFVAATITLNSSRDPLADRYPIMHIDVPHKAALGPVHTFLELGARSSGYRSYHPSAPCKGMRFAMPAKTFTSYWLCSDEQIDGFWQFLSNPQVREIFKL